MIRSAAGHGWGHSVVEVLLAAAKAMKWGVSGSGEEVVCRLSGAGGGVVVFTW